jgi:hypothetical protein
MQRKQTIFFEVLFLVILMVSHIQSAYAPTSTSLVIESSSTSSLQDVFSPDEAVYVHSTNIPSTPLYTLHVVSDTTWTEGMTIPTSLTTPVLLMGMDVTLWTPPLPLGEYDIIADNGDGVYNSDYDALDDFDVNGAGFIVEPFTREALWDRLVEIILAWPTSTAEQRADLWEEIVEIILLWPTAP